MSAPRSSKQRYREFRQRGTGPTPPKSDSKKLTQEPGRRKRYLREYGRWLWPYRWRLLTVFVLALVSAGLVLLLPLATRYIIDGILPHKTWTIEEKVGRLTFVCLALGAILVVALAVDTSRSYLMAILNAKVIFRLRQRLFERFLRLPLSDVTDMKSGGIVSRLSQDVDKVTGLVQMAFISPGVAAIRVMLTVFIIVFISWPLSLIASLMIPPIVIVNLLWVRRIRPIYRAMADARSEIDGRVTETFSGMRVVRTFRRERKEEHDYAVAHHTVIRKKLLAERLQLVVTSGWGFAIPATTLAIVGYGGYLVVHGKGTVGDIVAFQMYALLLLGPVSTIVNSLSSTQQSLAAMERVFDILDRAEDKPDSPNAVEAPATIRDIALEGVGFEYRAGLPVLRDISFRVPAGNTVALVGPSGGGKTTLTDLVARLHDPTEGSVQINGTDLRRFRLASYRRKLAVVPQDVFLFDGSVAENIAYGRRGATLEAIVDAGKRANAHEFIEQLPEAYDTIVGERGIKLSGGQRQRLSIARAILADPEILIMDEATSNLDTESEQLIQASLADLISTRTTFVIAHRLSTITHADIIVVLDHGSMVQIGDHTSLMAVEGLYRDMVRRQERLHPDQAGAIEWT